MQLPSLQQVSTETEQSRWKGKPGMVAYTFNSNTWESETGRSLHSRLARSKERPCLSPDVPNKIYLPVRLLPQIITLLNKCLESLITAKQCSKKWKIPQLKQMLQMIQICVTFFYIVFVKLCEAVLLCLKHLLVQ